MTLTFEKNETYDNIFILDTFAWMADCFKLQSKKEIVNKTRILDAVFDIRTPFLMDGEALKISQKIEEKALNNSIEDILEEYFYNKACSKAKRLKLKPLSPGDKEDFDYVVQQFNKFKISKLFKNVFTFKPSAVDFKLNNSLSREGRHKFLALTDVPYDTYSGENNSSESVFRHHNDRRYLIPPKSRYVNGDVFQVNALFSSEKFDFVVMDPPWMNKHIRRKRKMTGLAHSYETCSASDMLNGIPLRSILSEECLVFIWITVNNNINAEVMSKLHLWGLEYITTWFWIKVTRSGYPIVHLSTTKVGKLPYEKLIVTRKKNSHRIFPKDLKKLTFYSVPSSIHSHKPPLKDILSHLFGKDESHKFLELFARSLTPGWTSVGMEVLRLQDLCISSPIAASENT